MTTPALSGRRVARRREPVPHDCGFLVCQRMEPVFPIWHSRTPRPPQPGVTTWYPRAPDGSETALSGRWDAVKTRFHVALVGPERGLLDLEEELSVALGLAHLLHEELQGLLGL